MFSYGYATGLLDWDLYMTEIIFRNFKKARAQREKIIASCQRWLWIVCQTFPLTMPKTLLVVLTIVGILKRKTLMKGMKGSQNIIDIIDRSKRGFFDDNFLFPPLTSLHFVIIISGGKRSLGLCWCYSGSSARNGGHYLVKAEIKTSTVPWWSSSWILTMSVALYFAKYIFCQTNSSLPFLLLLIHTLPFLNV